MSAITTPRRMSAATLLVAAAAATVLSVAPPASAATHYVALAYSPSTNQYGFAKDTNSDRAVTRSLSNCAYVAPNCVYLTQSKNGCIALATRGQNPNGGPIAYGAGNGPTRVAAITAAQRASGGGGGIFSYCL